MGKVPLVKAAKLGDRMYYVRDYYLFRPGEKVLEGRIKALSLHHSPKDHNIVDENLNITLYTDQGEAYISGRRYKEDLFFSKKKATNVFENRKKIIKKQQEKQDKERRIYKDNEDLVKNFTEFSSGDTILIKVEDGEWVKSSIRCIRPTYKENQLAFIDTKRRNTYLFSRQGKNWKPWTKLDELKHKRETLDKEIEELEEL